MAHKLEDREPQQGTETSLPILPKNIVYHILEDREPQQGTETSQDNSYTYVASNQKIENPSRGRKLNQHILLDIFYSIIRRQRTPVGDGNFLLVENSQSLPQQYQKIENPSRGRKLEPRKCQPGYYIIRRQRTPVGDGNS